MPLLDHFHPPIYPREQWHGFHHLWAGNIATDLNGRLPPRYIALPHAQFGIEIDVASLRDLDQAWRDDLERADALWQPPTPMATIPFATTVDEVGVSVYYSSGGEDLAAAIELVSPANKDRPTSRDAFTAKCENYLRDGLGVVVVDIVTDRSADLHNALLARLDPDRPTGDARSLSVVAYRPRADSLDIWREPLALGGELPMMPLWLKTGPCLAVDLETTYRQTRRALRIGNDSP